MHDTSIIYKSSFHLIRDSRCSSMYKYWLMNPQHQDKMSNQRKSRKLGEVLKFYQKKPAWENIFQVCKLLHGNNKQMRVPSIWGQLHVSQKAIDIYIMIYQGSYKIFQTSTLKWEYFEIRIKHERIKIIEPPTRITYFKNSRLILKVQ